MWNDKLTTKKIRWIIRHNITTTAIMDSAEVATAEYRHNQDEIITPAQCVICADEPEQESDPMIVAHVVSDVARSEIFQTDAGGIALHNAIRQLNLPLVKILLRDPSTNVNERGIDGETALMVAVELCKRSAFSAPHEPERYTVEVEASHMISEPTSEHTPLRLIVREISRCARTDLNATDHNGDTALIYAAQSNCYVMMCEMSAGAIINKVPLRADHMNNNNETALSIAMKEKEIYAVNQLVSSSIATTSIKNVNVQILSKFLNELLLHHERTGSRFHSDLATKLYKLYKAEYSAGWPLNISLWGIITVGSAVIFQIIAYNTQYANYMINKIFAFVALLFGGLEIFRAHRAFNIDQFKRDLPYLPQPVQLGEPGAIQDSPQQTTPRGTQQARLITDDADITEVYALR
ncbi:MAG: hypothetical protein CMF43_02230 [Legionellales bacterium]|nr:hypothetical protein [Legionellales bacterium]